MHITQRTLERQAARAWMRSVARAMRSDSPRYLDASVEAVTLKNVVPHSVATAFASIVLPVPGGPNIRTPFHGRRMPCGDGHKRWAQA